MVQGAMLPPLFHSQVALPLDSRVQSTGLRDQGIQFRIYGAQCVERDIDRHTHTHTHIERDIDRETKTERKKERDRKREGDTSPLS